MGHRSTPNLKTAIVTQVEQELAARRLPGSTECRALDLADFGSVREFAGRVCAEAAAPRGRRVKLLINKRRPGPPRARAGPGAGPPPGSLGVEFKHIELMWLL